MSKQHLTNIPAQNAKDVANKRGDQKDECQVEGSNAAKNKARQKQDFFFLIF